MSGPPTVTRLVTQRMGQFKVSHADGTVMPHVLNGLQLWNWPWDPCGSLSHGVLESWWIAGRDEISMVLTTASVGRMPFLGHHQW
jgi:hypothetical protein